MSAISHYCGITAIKNMMAEFVHNSLTKSAHIQTYVGMIHLIPDQKKVARSSSMKMNPGVIELMNPPPRIVQSGKPKKKRKREPYEAPKVGRSSIVI
ncbi:hypothetical protein Ddye_015923 [Dipteronia dyeriana]|uniref:Uncharacterized protein n=1 Tax=Dipteronia dyeriana TaxID=168575 RepID=A0AAD9WYC7_9ROSI|nr:hypothetical protein Ddye_015923 [Dipteronia dyeriana]